MPISLSSSRSKEIDYHIGIDGGGTRTRARLASAQGVVLGFAASGPSALGQGIEQAWKHIAQAIDLAFAGAGLAPAPRERCALGLGLAGANVQQRCEDFLDRAPSFAKIALDTDAYTTLLGAHQGRPGAIVAAGTGSVGEALHRDGMRVAVGGWGFPVGDEGSGAWLGLRAMRETHRAVDGRASVGPLVGAVLATAGTTREALLSWCDRPGQNAYAELAPLVFAAAATDPFAAHLLDRAARSLEEIAAALDSDGALPLAVCGSIGQQLLPRFDPSIRGRCVEPAGDATDGALRLVRQALSESRR
jgi:glucosamine kinase